MNPKKREFLLAGAIFVSMAIVGTAFGLWFVVNYAPNRAPSIVDPRR